MTQPRMCIPGTTYLITRTCSERRLLLRPDPRVNRIVAYCLARALAVCDVELHAFSIESNHYHLVLTALTRLALSSFMEKLNRMIACCLKEYYGRTHAHRALESVWSPGSFSAVALLTPEAVQKAIAYTLTNPVKDRLVSDYRKWPGLNTRPRHWAMAPRKCERPDVFFVQNDDEWKSLPLPLTVPPMLRDEERDLESIIRDAEQLVLDEQARLNAEHAGKPVLGARRAREVDPFDAPHGRRPARPLNPQLAAGGDGTMLQRAKSLLRAFRGAYREAYKRFVAGLDAVFPYGTLVMHERFGVVCEPAFEPPWCAAAMTG